MSERWYHAHGCRRWFTLSRDTATDAVLSAPEPVGDVSIVEAWRLIADRVRRRARLNPRPGITRQLLRPGRPHGAAGKDFATGGRIDPDHATPIRVRRPHAHWICGRHAGIGIARRGRRHRRPKRESRAGARDPHGRQRRAERTSSRSVARPRFDLSGRRRSSARRRPRRPQALAGKGPVLDGIGTRSDRRYAHCDVLVVGGGPAGLAAALAAGRSRCAE